MTVVYPTTLDALSNPTGTDLVNSADPLLKHDRQHSDANDAIEALEAKVGVNSSAVTTSHDYKLGEVTSTDKAVGKTASQTLTNKTLTTPTIADFTNANHNHTSAAQGGLLTQPTIQVYAAGSGTWTKPAGLTHVVVECQGPGGGGGQGTTTNNGGGGGGGGYCRKFYLASALSATEAYVVGAGGAGHQNSAGSGSNGSAASTWKSLSGGAGTGGGQTNGGQGGASSGGDINIPGQTGSSNGTATLVNFGGNAFLGMGGSGGGYGSGGYPGNASGANGGNGTDGVIIVHEFYT